LVPVLGCGIKKRLGKVDSSIVHESVNASELLHGLLYKPFQIPVVPNVATYGERAFTEEMGHSCGRFATNVSNDDIRTFPVANARNALAKTASCARYDDAFVFKRHKCILPCCPKILCSMPVENTHLLR
jgi:hypothetical protein